MVKFTGTKYEKDLKFCVFTPEESIENCPIHSEKNHEGFEHHEFVMVIHNPSMYNQSIARVKLDTKKYKAKVWSRES